MAGALIGLNSLAVHAAKGLTYSFGELGYTNLDSDDLDGHAASAHISVAATDYIYMRFDYSHFNGANLERGSFFGKKTFDVDIDRFLVGLGGHYTVLEDASVFLVVDVFGTLSYHDAQFNNDVNRADRGYQLDAGARTLVSKNTELNATLT